MKYNKADLNYATSFLFIFHKKYYKKIKIEGKRQ